MLIDYLIKLKNYIMDVRESEDLSLEDKKYIEKTPKQNPYGLFTMLIGGIAFTFGNKYVLIPIISIVFGLVTIRTFVKAKEDNIWPFYIGIGLSVIGLVMYMMGYSNNLIY